jgi:hypothetical protein
MVLSKEQISYQERIGRIIYDFLAEELDRFLVKKSIIDSFYKFLDAGLEYPFVDKRELKPRARIYEKEYPLHNSFLAIFCEGTLPSYCKRYIRFFETNKLVKENLQYLVDFKLYKSFSKNLSYFDQRGFFNALEQLLPLDFALLIQRDGCVKATRYLLSHFRVKIDWSIDAAAEELAKELRYISKDLYEKEEKYAQLLQQKFFEYYSFHHTAAGRRTAAIIATQYLKHLDFISTIYVSSSSSRSLTKINTEGSLARFVLLQLSNEEIKKIAQQNDIKEELFEKYYILRCHERYGVGIFEVTYTHPEAALPPLDGKLRELNPDHYWLVVDKQLLLPMLEYSETRPLDYRMIYV